MRIQAKAALEGAIEVMEANLAETEIRLREIQAKIQLCQETIFCVFDTSTSSKAYLDDIGSSAQFCFDHKYGREIMLKRQTRLEYEAARVRELLVERRGELVGMRDQLKHVESLAS